MPYSKTSWVNNSAPAIDAANLNNIEDGISKAPYGPDFSANNVPVWNGASWVAQKVAEAQLNLTDVTTGNVSSTAHGFAPKSPADATKFLNGATVPAWAAVKGSDLSMSDVTTNNVSSTAHGFAPKSPADATKFLNGATTPAFAQVKDSDLTFTDITTNNVSTTAHGFAPKAPNDATKYLDGTGAYSVPAGGGGGSTDGWTAGETWTYASATTFIVSGVDVTAKYAPGTRLKLTQTTVKYFVVASSSFSTNTTVTITGGSDYSLANAAITSNYYSYQSNPQGYPGWFNFAASLAGTSALTTNVARFSVVGRACLIALDFIGTSNATTKSITLPITPANISNLQWIIPLSVKDNGTLLTTPGEIIINPNTASASLYKDSSAGNAWTASGSWFAIGPGSYEI